MLVRDGLVRNQVEAFTYTKGKTSKRGEAIAINVYRRTSDDAFDDTRVCRK